MEGSCVAGHLTPEVVAISFPAIRDQHKAEGIPIGYVVPERAIAQLHPGIAFVAGPKRAITVKKEGQTTTPLVTDEGLLVNGVTLPKPVGDGQAVGEGLTTFPKKVVEKSREPNPEIVVLLDMPVFVYRQQFFPGQAAEVEAVLFRCKLEFAAEGGESHITVGDGGLVLQDDVDLPLCMTDGKKGGLAELMDNGGHPLCLRVETHRKDDPGSVGIELVPFQGGGIAAENLGVGSCRQQEQSGE